MGYAEFVVCALQSGGLPSVHPTLCSQTIASKIQIMLLFDISKGHRKIIKTYRVRVKPIIGPKGKQTEKISMVPMFLGFLTFCVRKQFN